MTWDATNHAGFGYASQLAREGSRKRPTKCPDCESRIEWIDAAHGYCACNGDAGPDNSGGALPNSPDPR